VPDSQAGEGLGNLGEVVAVVGIPAREGTVVVAVVVEAEVLVPVSEEEGWVSAVRSLQARTSIRIF